MAETIFISPLAVKLLQKRMEQKIGEMFYPEIMAKAFDNLVSDIRSGKVDIKTFFSKGNNNAGN